MLGRINRWIQVGVYDRPWVQINPEQLWNLGERCPQIVRNVPLVQGAQEFRRNK